MRSARLLLSALTIGALTLPLVSASAAATCEGSVFVSVSPKHEASVFNCKTVEPNLRYLAAASGAWTIKVTRGSQLVQTLSSANQDAASGVLANEAGDVVTATFGDSALFSLGAVGVEFHN